MHAEPKTVIPCSIGIMSDDFIKAMRKSRVVIYVNEYRRPTNYGSERQAFGAKWSDRENANHVSDHAVKLRWKITFKPPVTPKFEEM